MKKLFCIILLCFICRITAAQNLVPNGDFEQHIGCNFSIGTLSAAEFWINPTNSSPDYFNQCAISASVPYAYFGFQYPNSGAGYAGFYVWLGVSNHYREYIEVPLIAPLVANQCYSLSMWVNLANSVKYTSDAIGAYFSDTLIDVQTYYELPFVPQVQNTAGNMPDTTYWDFVSDNFIANGGESFMIIGNFLNDSVTNLVPVNNILIPNDSACYFYIDDICLKPCFSTCLTGIDEDNSGQEINIYPNPASEKINIDYPVNGVLEIINSLGQTLIKTETFARNKKVSVDVRNLPPGIYIVRSTYFSVKFVKE